MIEILFILQVREHVWDVMSLNTPSQKTLSTLNILPMIWIKANCSYVINPLQLQYFIIIYYVFVISVKIDIRVLSSLLFLLVWLVVSYY